MSTFNTLVTKDYIKNALVTDRLVEPVYSRSNGDLLFETKIRDKMSEVEMRNDYYFRNSYRIGLIDTSQLPVEISEWANDMIARIKANFINDKDKVYFGKASLFPRASFNRYSDKARLVQVTKTATKYVIPHRTIRAMHTRNIGGITGEWTDDAGVQHKDAILVNIESMVHQIRNCYRSDITDKVMLACFDEASKNRYNYTKKALGLGVEFLKQELEKELGITYTTFEAAGYTTLTTDKKSDLQTLELLATGEVELDQIVSDEAVNVYIDGFKDNLDDNTYDYLLQTLGSHTSDPEVPMQLLTNMSIDAGNPRLDGLFLNLSTKAINNILGHRVMNTVDVKNFANQHKLYQLLDTNQAYNLQAKLSVIGRRCKLYSSNDNRRKLFDLVEDELDRMFNEMVNIPDGKIKISYEALTND